MHSESNKPYQKMISTVFVIIFIVIVGIILGTIVIFYIDNRINLNGIDENIFGQFGDFVGGVAGTFINFTSLTFLYLTFRSQRSELVEARKLTQLQINLSMKPDLFFIDSDVFIYPQSNAAGIAYPLNIQTALLNEPDSNKQSQVAVSLINIGVGTAKNIQYKWHFDMNAAVDFINSQFDLHDIKVSTNETGSYIDIDLGPGMRYSQGDHLSFTRSIDVVLPYRSEPDAIKIPYPTTALKTYMIAAQLSINKPGFDLFDVAGFPLPILEISYMDIADTLREKRFEFKLSYNSFAGYANDTVLMVEGKLVGRELTI